jgi:histidinol-phosphate/aromatic aminotransferase/cobyric acid decarboxylase-like protein
MHKRPLHGGSSWEIVHGHVEELTRVVTADVCDAWYAPAPEVIEGLKGALKYVQYAPETWGEGLSEFIGNHYGLPSESVFVDAGSSPLIHRVLTNLGARGGNVILLSPTYSEYRGLLEQCKIEIRFDNLRLDQKLRVDVDRLLGLIDEKTTAVVLCNPNNPTGSVIPRAEMLRLVQSVPERVSIIIDEVYIEYTPECSVLKDILTYPSLCVIRSFSKGHALAGLRAGFAAAGAAHRGAFHEFDELPWRISLLSDVGVRLALQHETYMRQRIDETIVLRDKLRKMVSAINEYDPFSSDTNFFLVRINDPELTPDSVVRRLKKKRVLIKEVESFRDSQPSRFIRVTTRSEDENDRIVSALESAVRK